MRKAQPKMKDVSDFVHLARSTDSKSELEDHEGLLQALRGTSFQKLSGNWKMEQWRNSEVIAAEKRSVIAKCFTKLGVMSVGASWRKVRLGVQRMMVSHHTCGSSVKEDKRWNKYGGQYQKDVEGMYCEEDEVLVADDKDRTVMWKMKRFIYTKLTLAYMVVCPGWTWSAKSVHEVADSFRRKVSRILPEWLLKKTKIMDTGLEVIPYAYSTVKSKCYRGEGSSRFQRTCEKKSHSCVRKIISSI